MKLGDECSSLHATVNQLKCKLESCQKKHEARERELEAKIMAYCNLLEVQYLRFMQVSFALML